MKWWWGPLCSVGVASPLSTQHCGEWAKTYRLGIRIMCASGGTCLPTDCCFSELALWINNSACWSSTKINLLYVPFDLSASLNFSTNLSLLDRLNFLGAIKLRRAYNSCRLFCTGVPVNNTLGVLDTTLCDKVCQWLATSLWFSPGTPVSPTNKTDRHDITEILLKVNVVIQILMGDN
jgi:hypothetical protein